LALQNSVTDIAAGNSFMFFVNAAGYLSRYIHAVCRVDTNAGHSISMTTLHSSVFTASASINESSESITITIDGIWSNSTNWSCRITAS
jgi:hypothetical protein